MRPYGAKSCANVYVRMILRKNTLKRMMGVNVETLNVATTNTGEKTTLKSAANANSGVSTPQAKTVHAKNTSAQMAQPSRSGKGLEAATALTHNIRTTARVMTVM